MGDDVSKRSLHSTTTMPPSTQPWLRRALTPEGFRQVTGALEERELSRYLARAQSREAAERERDPSIKPLTPMEAIMVDSAQAFHVEPAVLDYYAVSAGCQPCNEQHNRYIEVEPYDRAMSPQPIDILKLPAEERDIDILTQKEALAALVSIVNRSTRMTC